MIQTRVQQHLDKIESPYWLWDKKSGRYRDRSTGRFLSQANLEILQRRHIAAIEKDIQTIGDLLLRGQISLATFQEATVRSLKTLHIHQMVLSVGGIHNATAADYLTVGRELKTQYGYLQQFAVDLQRGYGISEKGDHIPMTVPKFKARLSLYVKAGRISYEQGKQTVAKSRGRYFMSRSLGVAEHCADCLRYAAMGIQPIGMLPLPGVACACRANCRCSVKYFSSIKEALESTRGISSSSTGFS